MVDADHGRGAGDGPARIGRLLVGSAVGNRGIADADWLCRGLYGGRRSFNTHGAQRKRFDQPAPEAADEFVIRST